MLDTYRTVGHPGNNTHRTPIKKSVVAVFKVKAKRVQTSQSSICRMAKKQGDGHLVLRVYVRISCCCGGGSDPVLGESGYMWVERVRVRV